MDGITTLNVIGGKHFGDGYRHDADDYGVIRGEFVEIPEKIPRMMTIRQIAETGFMPEYALRNLVKNGAIPSLKSGNRYWINFDKLIEMVS